MKKIYKAQIPPLSIEEISLLIVALKNLKKDPLYDLVYKQYGSEIENLTKILNDPEYV